MTSVYITINKQRTLPKINENGSVQGEINQTIMFYFIHMQTL